MRNRLLSSSITSITVKLQRSFLILLSICLFACKDDFFETAIPSWLGASIYEQLQTGVTDSSGVKHTFNVYTKLIDDIGYDEVLKKTGSKTVFVADDNAFALFFQIMRQLGTGIWFFLKKSL
ncbi:MAG TPA: hypothetical protein VI413_03995 [Paludibacter sp.]